MDCINAKFYISMTNFVRIRIIIPLYIIITSQNNSFFRRGSKYAIGKHEQSMAYQLRMFVFAFVFAFVRIFPRFSRRKMTITNGEKNAKLFVRTKSIACRPWTCQSIICNVLLIYCDVLLHVGPTLQSCFFGYELCRCLAGAYAIDKPTRILGTMVSVLTMFKDLWVWIHVQVRLLRLEFFK